MSPTSCHCSTPRSCWRVHGPTLPAGHPPVPSARQRFTSRFGMDRRGAAALNTHPWHSLELSGCPASYPANCIVWVVSVLPRPGPCRPLSPVLLGGKPSTLRCPSPPRVATRPAWVAYPSRLLGVLPGFTSESTHLRAGFPLRCFQRFALPDIATEPAGRPTTPPPAVRPARSSRTRASPLQCSTRSKRIETELSHDVLNPARVPL